MTKDEWIAHQESHLPAGGSPLASAAAAYVEAFANVAGLVVTDWTGLTITIHLEGGTTFPRTQLN